MPNYRVPLTVVKDGNTGLYSLIDAKGVVIVKPTGSPGEVLAKAATFYGIPVADLPIPTETVEIKNTSALSTEERLLSNSTTHLYADYQTGVDGAAVSLLKAQGVRVPTDRQFEFTVKEANGITTIEVVGGKTIKIQIGRAHV